MAILCFAISEIIFFSYFGDIRSDMPDSIFFCNLGNMIGGIPERNLINLWVFFQPSHRIRWLKGQKKTSKQYSQGSAYSASPITLLSLAIASETLYSNCRFLFFSISNLISSSLRATSGKR